MLDYARNSSRRTCKKRPSKKSRPYTICVRRELEEDWWWYGLSYERKGRRQMRWMDSVNERLMDGLGCFHTQPKMCPAKVFVGKGGKVNEKMVSPEESAPVWEGYQFWEGWWRSICIKITALFSQSVSRGGCPPQGIGRPSPATARRAGARDPSCAKLIPQERCMPVRTWSTLSLWEWS